MDKSPAWWSRRSEDERDAVHVEYWRRMRDLAASGLFDIAAHLDLPKKFGFRPRAHVKAVMEEALDAIAEAGMVVELNTAGWHAPCREQYPSRSILESCRGRGIPVTISADAHDPSHLVRDFDRAARELAGAGYDKLARFAGREVRLEGFQS